MIVNMFVCGLFLFLSSGTSVVKIRMIKTARVAPPQLEVYECLCEGDPTPPLSLQSNKNNLVCISSLTANSQSRESMREAAS